ncbi:uncharacterized protein LOC116178501 isoform X2 [Photinus pyralis]|uniref:uncharacterized protein LOC116173372 isoform X2 n=1 Tax=Photinus pyralis TaxID=7054 RepID=UPI001266EC51|nr:uncharacterized protein LOC116173372 isoform X2 [Photinus pyralis]XP_031353869.1 uncharacterized protein LOC116178501 isoform X2 [Photinus pyralis]
MDPSTNEYVKTREKTERKQDADDECDKSSPTFVEKPSSRRVSFASMNFIKQFAIDPEKNTIWDATYEEMLTLDSTHSSENVHGTLSARQTGSYNSDIRKEHVGDAEDFQLDLNLPNIWMDKENISFPNNSQTQKVHSSNKGNRKVLALSSVQFMGNKTVLNNSDMELTRAVTFQNVRNITLPINEAMDYTQCVAAENPNKVKNCKNVTLYDANIEYTCQIPHLNFPKMPLVVNRSITDSTSMDLTGGIGEESLVPCNSSPSMMEQTVPMTDYQFKDKTNVEGSVNIELTQNVSLSNLCSSSKISCDSSGIVSANNVQNEITKLGETCCELQSVQSSGENDKTKKNKLHHSSLKVQCDLNSFDNAQADGGVEVYSFQSDMEIDQTIPITARSKLNLSRDGIAIPLKISVDNSNGNCIVCSGEVKNLMDAATTDESQTVGLACQIPRLHFANTAANRSRQLHSFQTDLEIDQTIPIKELSDSNGNRTAKNSMNVAPTDESQTAGPDILIEKCKEGVLINLEKEGGQILPVKKCEISGVTCTELANKPEKEMEDVKLELTCSIDTKCKSISASQSMLEKSTALPQMSPLRPDYCYQNKSVQGTVAETLVTDCNNLSNCQSQSDFSKIITGELNPSFINSKVLALSDFSCDTFPTSLNNTRETMKDGKKKSFGLQATYVVDSNVSKQPSKSMSSQVPTDIRDVETHLNSHTGKSINISQEDITLLECSEDTFDLITQEAQSCIQNIANQTKASDENNVDFNQLWNGHKIEAQRIETSVQELADSITNSAANRGITTRFQSCLKMYEEVATQFSEKHKVKEFQDRHSRIVLKRASSIVAEDSLPLQTSSDFSENSIEILSYEEQIRRKCKRSKSYWTIKSLKGDFCQIHTLYKTIRLDVKFNTMNGIVSECALHDCILDTSDPIALLVHKHFKHRLIEKNIKSGVGEKYDILTLLDYVHINMEKMLDIFNEFCSFSKKYNFKLDKQFMGTFNIVNLILNSSWRFYVDMSELDNISKDSIRIEGDGATNEVHIREMKKLMNRVSCGLPFLKKFLSDALAYTSLCGAQAHG